MTLGYYLRLLARRWPIPLSLAVVGACLGLVYSGLQEVSYQARSTVLLSPLDPGTADELPRMTPTLARLVRSDGVLLAARRAYLAGAPADRGPSELDDLRARTSVEVPRETSLFEVTAAGPTQADANALVRAIVGAATREVARLTTGQRRRGPDGTPQLRFDVFGPPMPEGQVSPTPVRNVVLGANVGLLVGIAAALLLRDPRRSRMRADDLAQLLSASNLVYAPLPSQRLLRDRPRAALDPASAWRGPDDRRTEGIRLLGGRLWRWLQDDRRVVLLLGDVPPQTLRSVALRLAAHVARTGVQPVVVEADYHGAGWPRPAGDGRPGLGELLGRGSTDEAGAAEITVDSHGRNGDGAGRFSVVPRGAAPPEPALAFASDGYTSLIEALRASHHLVLVVGPAADWQAEVLALAERSDAVIVLVPAWIPHSRAAAMSTLSAIDPAATVLVSVFGDPSDVPLAAAREE